MRKYVAFVIIAMAMLTAAPASADVPKDCGQVVTAQEFRPISAKVWDHDLWERGKPGKAGVAAYQRALHCAKSPDHRQAILRIWRKDKEFYNRYRTKLQTHFVNYTWRGAVFPESAWFSLPQLKPYVAAALAEAAGDYTGTDMPGWTMVQMSQGEGDLKPGSRSTDCGYGWLAITCPYGDIFGVTWLGGYDEMLNPVKNAYVAARMYGAMGFSAWYGDGFVTDWDLHYTGKFDVRHALGGLTFGQALRVK
jgi:hypothetical protein